MSGSGDDALLSNIGAFEYDKHEPQSRGDKHGNIITINANVDAVDSDSTSQTETCQSTCKCVEAGRSDKRAENPRSLRPPGIGGCIDVSTVGELYPWKNLYGLTPRGDQIRLGFVIQQVIVPVVPCANHTL